MAPEIVTGSSLLEDRLPNLRYGTDKTHAPSLKGEYCLLPLAVWDKFEYRVRTHCDGLEKMDEVVGYTTPIGDFDISRDEMVVCGDEHSVVARFGQHVGQVMTTIFQQTESAKNVYFGDYKTYNNPTGSGKCPDIAVLERDQLLFVGEAKTPWAHKPGDLDTVNDVEFRKYLGQIYRYMHQHQLKYGFFTTYEQTIFLKQEHHPRGKRMVLWYSPIISHETKSRSTPTERENYPEYRGTVSVRECFLYFVSLARKGTHAVNPKNVRLCVNRAVKPEKVEVLELEDSSSDESSSRAGFDEDQ